VAGDGSQSLFDLKEIWKQKCAAAKLQMELAASKVQELEREWRAGTFSSIPVPDGSFAYRQALKAETQAVKTYRRILHIYTDLALRGIPPPETLSIEDTAE
jgi:hypothetical protein